MRWLPISKLLHTPWADRLLLAEAALWLGLARLALRWMPLRRIAPWLGRSTVESAFDPPGDLELLRRLTWGVEVASRYTPWRTTCLAEAMAGKAMLRCRGLASTLYLGVVKDGEDGLAAHAWLRCGDRVLTGEGRLAGHTTVAHFADTQP